jgi:hypothetical protein
LGLAPRLVSRASGENGYGIGSAWLAQGVFARGGIFEPSKL